MGVSPKKTRSDLTKKAQGEKKRQRDEEYLNYRRYIRSKQFKEVKKIVEERDGHKCMTCGRTRADGITLSCHHRCYAHLYEGGESEAEDCITVCSICHRAIHSAKKNYQHFSMKNPRNRNTSDRMQEDGENAGLNPN